VQAPGTASPAIPKILEDLPNHDGEPMVLLWQGIILGLSITAPIGPTNIEVIRRGTTGRLRAAISFWLGAIVALVLYLILVGFGLSFLTGSRLFITTLTACGVVVLAYLSYASIKDFFSASEIEWADIPDKDRNFVPGIVLTLSNPAVLLFWTGIMGANLATSQASQIQGLWLSLGILIGAVSFFVVLTILIHYGRKLIQRKFLKYISLVAGIVLLAFCVKFAVSLLHQFL
jgi:threonine/homoserine/homoserine lactone efflux protein